jgi:hypothetical protein
VSRKLVTACTEEYAEAALTLVASVHRTSSDLVDEIVVYDLGLTGESRARLEEAEGVALRDFPPAAYSVYRGYMAPRSYGWKMWIFSEARRYSEEGASVLWMDAGAMLVRSAAPIFEAIGRDGVFASSHDIDDGNDLTEQRWTTPLALERMGATAEERAARQACGCIFGWTVGGPFQQLVDEAFEWSRDPEILLGPIESHRYDQSILTILCLRHAVPFHPQAIYAEWRGADIDPRQVVCVHRTRHVDHSGLRLRAAPATLPATQGA